VTRPVRIALVADDLTSAADGAAPFRAAGFPARIELDAPAADGALGPDTGPPVGVTAVDVDTRRGPAALAGAPTARAVTRLAGADVLVKTMDSTVRGHLAVELAAALSASGRATAVIAPAFPAEGRTTVGGVQLLDGVPVHDTAFARDPGHPVRTADLTALVPGAVPVGREPGPGLAGLLGRAPYVVADASHDRDLDRIVAAVPDPRQVLWVGSPGLAEALARRFAPCAGPPSGAEPVGGGARVLVVVGSLHPASWAQAARLGADGTDALVTVLLDPPAGSADEVVAQAERQLTDRGVAVLHGPRQRCAGSVPGALAEVAARLAARRSFDALVLTGGETARAVLRALGARTILLAGQSQPGIPLGRLDRPWPLRVALKAGGFGDRDALARLVDLFTGPTPGRDQCVR
jgi:uncharacterized protein YgbK (DUF1537 family)